MKRSVCRFTTVTIAAICSVMFNSALMAFTVPETYSVSQRVEQFGPQVRARLTPWFKRINVPYPPRGICFIGIKNEKILEVWVADNAGNYVYLKNYPILAASGSVGPKLRRGDKQVPEGLYKIESLNPNSSFHLSLRLNYPNAYDKEMARKDGRVNLGGDIMIHGSFISTGCLAMGDDAAEDLFVLSAETGIENISVILSPVDFRVDGFSKKRGRLPAWSTDLYSTIQMELKKLQKTNDRRVD